MDAANFKRFGYAVSMVSVVLLGVPAWQSASEQPPMLLFLIGGMALSIIGMILRWLQFEDEQRQKRGG